MIINEAGEYTLQYTATDACGNSTTVERELTVEAPPTYRTVLYTDGTLIINESDRDEAHNIELHGAATNVYVPFDPNGATDIDKYIFTGDSYRLWNGQRNSITKIEVGSIIAPTSIARWAASCSNLTEVDYTKIDWSNMTSMEYAFSSSNLLTSIDLGNIDTSHVTNMRGTFAFSPLVTTIDFSDFDTSSVIIMESLFGGSQFENLDLSSFNTENVTTMMNMFRNCSNLKTVDISSFKANSLADISGMFNTCGQLTTIYSSENFVLNNVSSSDYLFSYCKHLVGGAGTAWASGNPNDKTYARIDNPPSAPGYFTAKS